MKTDTIFYSIFQSFPNIFFELINKSPEEASAYDFTSCEVKQLAFRLDGLFLPKNNAPDKPFYIVEIQFQPDENLYYRLFAELFIYLRQYKPPHPWQVVVIYPNRSIEREQTLHFSDILVLNRVQRIYLNELGENSEASIGVGIVKLVIEDAETAPTLAKKLIAQANQQLTEINTKLDLINLIEAIIVYKLPQKSREEIEAMLGLNDLKQSKVYQEALEEGKQQGLEEGKQQGLEEGKQQGLEEGKYRAKLEAIPRMLQFGLSLEAIAQLLDLPVEVVQQAVQQS